MLMIAPSAELRVWSEKVYKSGDRIKASKINRVIDRMEERRGQYRKDHPHTCDHRTFMTFDVPDDYEARYLSIPDIELPGL